jgi:phosphatidylserine/phosphatidylglycerophosphate/cardiolipin synthase-like enzyme
VSTTLEGRLVDENGAPWESLTVSVHDTVGLFASKLGSATTAADGRFEIPFPDDPFVAEFGRRPVEVVVQDRVRRVLLRREFDDSDAPRLLVGDLVLRRADVLGFLVTLGTGAATALSRGNAVKLLIDEEAFEHGAARFEDATSSVLMSQLYFDVPKEFHTNPADETPSLIFRFTPPPPTVAGPTRKVQPGDVRPERVLLDLAANGGEVKILVHGYRLPLFLRLLVGALVFPVVGSDGVFALDEAIHDKLPAQEFPSLIRYFTVASQPRVTAREFTQHVSSAGVMHAKLVVVDGKRALSYGSPFGQSYNDDRNHAIDAPRRGNSGGFPKHDAGFEVTGPAVADIHEMLRILWNENAAQPDQLQPLPAPPEETQAGSHGADDIASVQIVRTLSSDRLDAFPQGEKGILEAYLRAIANAQDFIYFENQYFTNDAIGDALAEAMKANPDLQVIALLNIDPDVPLYPFKQRRLITRIREAIDEDPSGRPRFGVFTRWTHETGSPRPRILPIYVHAKIGIVDNTWATVGSANLDGYSLDSSLIGDVLVKLFGLDEARAMELNAVLLNGVGGQPATGVVDLLRRRLFAEHLGFAGENEPTLQSPGSQGWLKLWQERASEKLERLLNEPAQSQAGLGHVLPWPSEDSTYDTPRKHLNALAVLTHRIVPLRSTRPFLFKDGVFKPGATPEMDYD